MKASPRFNDHFLGAMFGGSQLALVPLDSISTMKIAFREEMQTILDLLHSSFDPTGKLQRLAFQALPRNCESINLLDALQRSFSRAFEPVYAPHSGPQQSIL